MDDAQRTRARFVHLAKSPITALQGAVTLLARRASLLNDEQAQTLLRTMHRSVARLRVLTDAIVDHVELHGDHAIVTLALPQLEAQDGAMLSTYPPLLPVVPPPAPEPVEPDVQGACVLIAEPDDARGAMLFELLAAAGHDVIYAANGTRAVDLAREARPDLVVLNLDLEDPDGLRVAQVLEEDPETKQVSIVFTSAYPERIERLPPYVVAVPAADITSRMVATVREALIQARIEKLISVLVVDDEPEITQVLRVGLESAGFAVTVVHGGAAALQRTLAQPFDLIVLDLMLPDIDGFAVLGALRARTQTALTPIILLSALHDPHEKAHGLHLGADDYVTKPFNPVELEARIRAALRRRELEGSANPSTRLPGNISIERVIRQRIDSGAEFAVCYLDLDNFKPYNDTYGFLKGDAVIHQTARILAEVVKQHGNQDDFLGHIGGDDFVIVTTPARVDLVCAEIIARFDAMVPLLYDPETRQRGFIVAYDRQGHVATFPFLSISIAVVTNTHTRISHPADVGDYAVELKKRAKHTVGSVVIVV